MKFLWCVIVALVAMNGWTTKADGPCTVDTGNGVTIDLSTITPSVEDIEQVFGTPPYNRYWWPINLCEPNPPALSVTPHKACPDQGYVQEFNQDGNIDCQQSFNTMTDQWAWNGTAVNALFTAANGNVAKVGIICGNSPGLTSLWSVPASSNGQIYTWGFQFSSSAACPSSGPPTPPTPPNPGPSDSGSDSVSWSGSGSVHVEVTVKGGAGAIFVIIVFVGALLYVIGTILWNYFRLGKRGKDLAPHPEFWKGLPFLVKDGIVFTFQKIRDLCKKTPCCKGRGGDAGGYSSV